MTRQATAAEVRKHYTDQGYRVRVTTRGHVTFNREDGSGWLEGRWVKEYRVDDNGQVHLS